MRSSSGAARARCFATCRGLGDLLEIGTQERPELFALEIVKPKPLYERAVELAGRIDARGRELEALDEAQARAALLAARRAGLTSVAIVGAHAYLDPRWEERIAELAREAGFAQVSASSEVAREQGMLARGETAVVDAALTPLLRAHVRALEASLPGARLRFMQSSGGLTSAARFRAPGALLSGPAGGVVGAARVAREAGFARAIGFDMGGTSTDVSLVLEGEPERAFETVVAGVRVLAPMLRIHTIAAGGGSLCRFDGTRLLVGPESAGATPGPLAYGRPEARALTLSDANHWLGRLPGDRFPFALHPERVERGFGELRAELAAAGLARSADELAAGFVEIANAAMAQAIAEVSIARGVDPRELALVAFGGAAGQHACAVARKLGMRSVLLHPLAGVLSAYGIGLAAQSWDGQRDAGRATLAGDGRAPAPVLALLDELEREGRARLSGEGADAELDAERSLDLRYQGAEAALTLPAPPDGDFAAAFARAHRARFGYERPRRAVEVTTARVRLVAGGRSPASGPVPSAARAAGAPAPLRFESVWFPGVGRVRAPLYAREALPAGARLAGPALVLDAAGTLALDPGFEALQRPDGLLIATDREGVAPSAARPSAAAEGAPPDPVRIEVLGNRFASIAEMMGAVLRKTAVSVNIKERLDYSCAVFDAQGGLVANAPHIPGPPGRDERHGARRARARSRAARGRRDRHQRPGGGRLAPAGRDGGLAGLRRRRAALLRGEPRPSGRSRWNGARLDARRLDHARGRGRRDPRVPARARRPLRRGGAARAPRERAPSRAQPRRQRRGSRGDGGREPRRRAAARGLRGGGGGP